MRLQQNHTDTWNKFDLTVCSVQMHKDALQNDEWTMNHTEIEKTNHKNSSINIVVSRQHGFYMINVVGIMSSLSILGYSVFVFGDEASKESELADRVNTCLTLILTAVAFKFAISDSMPKLGYLTLMDEFFLLNMANLFLVVLVNVAWAMVLPTLETDEDEPLFGTLNAKIGTGTLAFFVLMNINWIRKANQSGDISFDQPQYTVVDKVNWYQSLFANPIFLADAFVQKEEKEEKKE